MDHGSRETGSYSNGKRRCKGAGILLSLGWVAVEIRNDLHHVNLTPLDSSECRVDRIHFEGQACGIAIPGYIQTLSYSPSQPSLVLALLALDGGHAIAIVNLDHLVLFANIHIVH